MLVVIESPYAGDVERNVRYARRAMADCIRRGESPFASHLLYTQPGVLDDMNPVERMRGIQAGFEWARCAERVIFYTDYGWSPGMLQAQQEHLARLALVEYRTIGPNP